MFRATVRSMGLRHFSRMTGSMSRVRGARCLPVIGVCTRRTYALSTEGEHIEDKIDDLTPGEYNRIANEYLEGMGDDLELLAEDCPQVDAELASGVLTLTIPPNGTYVINKQPPNKQIWLSSPVSGPKRYDLIRGKWITLRDGSALTQLLEEEISAALDRPFSFESLEN